MTVLSTTGVSSSEEARRNNRVGVHASLRAGAIVVIGSFCLVCLGLACAVVSKAHLRAQQQVIGRATRTDRAAFQREIEEHHRANQDFAIAK
jgi:hypothetical protein